MMKNLVVLITVSAVAAVACADIIATASFEDNTIGSLHGQAGGTGFQGTWDAQSSAGTASDFTTVVTKNLTYSGTNFTVNGGSQAVQYSVTGTNTEMAAMRQLALPFSAGSGNDEVLYYRFMMNYAANGVGSTEGDDRCFVSLTEERDKNGNPWWNKLRGGSRLSAGDDWYLKTDTAAHSFGGDLSPSTDVHMIVVKLFKSKGVNEFFYDFDMFVDPQDKSVESALLEMTAPTDDGHLGGYQPSEINWLGLLGRTLDAGDEYYVDDVVVATTWEEAVTGVPEPTTLGILALGAILIKRKK